MRDAAIKNLRNILVFAAWVEAGAGLASMIAPKAVVSLLLGVEAGGVGALLARCFGIALLALGLACWPDRYSAGVSLPAFRGMLAYNALVALYLAYLGAAGLYGGMPGGLLLWPAVALHAVVAVSLIWVRSKVSRVPSVC